MTSNDHKVGDVVRLKSNGPPMTVWDTDGRKVRCQWFNKNHDLKEGDFYVDIITRTVPD